MIKSELKQLTLECLKEVFSNVNYKPQDGLKVIAELSGKDINHIRSYVKKLVEVLVLDFSRDIKFENDIKHVTFKSGGKKSNIMFTLYNQKNVRFTTVILEQIHEELILWANNEKLKVDLVFKIDNK